MVGGILTYAIGQIKTFPVWRAIFLLCGGITVLWGFVLLAFFPDDIIHAKQFSLQDRATLVARGKLGRTGILNRKIKAYQIKEALCDMQIWLLVLYTLLNETINGGYANFGKLIIKGLVNDPLKTTALGIPLGAFQVFWILTGGYLASRFPNCRTYVMMLYLVPTIIGFSLMWRMDRQTQMMGVLFGYYICGSFVSSLVVALQFPAANLAGYTKRVTGTVLVFAAYCIGNIIGPHAFLEREAPIYTTGCKLGLGCAAGQVAVAYALRLLLLWRNKKRDQAQAAGAGLPEVDVVDEESIDLTDFEVSCPIHIPWLSTHSMLTRTPEPKVPICLVSIFYLIGFYEGMSHHLHIINKRPVF